MAEESRRAIWQKDTRPEDWVTRFTVGEDYRWDTLLLPYDVQGSLAHAWGLQQIGVLTQAELASVEATFVDLIAAYEAGDVLVTPADEDCHTVIERYLTERLGDTGKKIHTGRSRNDQVLTALRLYLRDELESLGNKTAAVAEQLCALGTRYAGVLMPGYTHLQRAMPTTAGLWAMGYAEMLVSDLEALRAAHAQVNVSPLGSAAGYGVPYLALPREAVSERLGFRAVQVHVPVVQLSRGKLELHVVHALVQVGATINRLASDLVLYNTAEFGFVTLPAAFCTGSSIMPQKQNPDVLELARANYHRLLAEMHVLLTLPANLPSGYHRDLQLTKEAVMRSVLLSHDVLTAMENLLEGLAFDPERLAAAASSELYATAYALRLVQEGVPFREAYRRAAKEPEGWDREKAEVNLDAYRVDGFPGRLRPDLIRRRVQEAAFWPMGRG